VEAPSDNELVRKLRAGDLNALAEIFNIHRERLRQMIALRLDERLGGRVSGSDVLQEVYIDALKRIDHFFQQPDLPAYLWLRLLTQQRLVDVHRQHLGADMRTVAKEVAMAPNDYQSASSVCIARHLAAKDESPSATVSKREQMKAIEAALESMDPIDREVLALRHFEELSNDEAAQILGLKKAAASNRYVRALQRLKDVLNSRG